MKQLSAAVAIFGLLALAAGIHKGEPETLLLAAAALICAYTTWRAREISSFLKILVSIFAAETVVFGLGVLCEVVGLWPQSYAEYALPATLAITVAVFSIVAFAVFHIPIVRRVMRITDLYFDSDARDGYRLWPLPAFTAREATMATALIVALVLFLQVLVGISLRLSYIRRDYYSALQDMNAAVFWSKMLFGFIPWAFVHVAVAVTDYVMRSYLVIRWRRWLTQHYIDRWLGGHRHYGMTLEGGVADNPDQRIAEDVNFFIDGGDQSYGVFSFAMRLISSMSSLVSYSIVLWEISAQLTFFDGKLVIPGLLFWIALVYVSAGTVVTHMIGRPLAKLNFERQRREANFRFGLARLREYSEQVALLSGENAERANLRGAFSAIYQNFLSIVERRKKLAWFTSVYGQFSPIFPFVLTAPFVLAGKIKIGVIRQTADAFGIVDDALNFFVNYYTYLAEFNAVLLRLESFDAATDRADVSMKRASLRSFNADGLTLDLRLLLPNGAPIVEARSLAFAPGVATLLSGPSGSGKSTLFRVIAGVWPHFDGAVSAQQGASIMLLPQRPYLPIGTLRSAVAYPTEAGAHTREELEAALVAARLAPLANSLDEETNWGQRLSGGEQQRVAIARALIAKPDWLFLDEATSALDEALEADIYEMLAERLPHTTIVSIGHRTTLRAFHQRRLVMARREDGLFAPREEVMA
jgi:putative ATP-binding cassette transporter